VTSLLLVSLAIRALDINFEFARVATWDIVSRCVPADNTALSDFRAASRPFSPQGSPGTMG
jgi:hypothetical protein